MKKIRILLLVISIFSLGCFTASLNAAELQNISDSIPIILVSKLPAEGPEPGNQPFTLKIARKTRFVLPALMIGYGFTSLNKGYAKQMDQHLSHELLEKYPYFKTNIDNKLQYAPMTATFTLSFMGVKGKNRLLDQMAIYLISKSIMGFSVDQLKGLTHKQRPSGFDSRSFPSGHTATAFVGAEFMRQEFSGQSPWYGYVGYSMAAATGALRMMNNQHWLSDVLAGAGVGILSTKFTYLAYPWIKKRIIKNDKLNFIAVPVVQNHTVGFSIMAPL